MRSRSSLSSCDTARDRIRVASRGGSGREADAGRSGTGRRRSSSGHVLGQPARELVVADRLDRGREADRRGSQARARRSPADARGSRSSRVRDVSRGRFPSRPSTEAAVSCTSIPAVDELVQRSRARPAPPGCAPGARARARSRRRRAARQRGDRPERPAGVRKLDEQPAVVAAEPEAAQLVGLEPAEPFQRQLAARHEARARCLPSLSAPSQAPPVPPPSRPRSSGSRRARAASPRAFGSRPPPPSAPSPASPRARQARRRARGGCASGGRSGRGEPTCYDSS